MVARSQKRTTYRYFRTQWISAKDATPPSWKVVIALCEDPEGEAFELEAYRVGQSWRVLNYKRKGTGRLTVTKWAYRVDSLLPCTTKVGTVTT